MLTKSRLLKLSLWHHKGKSEPELFEDLAYESTGFYLLYFVHLYIIASYIFIIKVTIYRNDGSNLKNNYYGGWN